MDEPTQLALVRLRSARADAAGHWASSLGFRGNGVLAIFDMVIAENGAVVFAPETGETRTLSAPPQEVFVAELSRRGVIPLGIGRSIVDTREPHETTVLEAIKRPALKANAALVTQDSPGAGVTELIESALRGDLDSHIPVDGSV